jgi:hypothetical protein
VGGVIRILFVFVLSITGAAAADDDKRLARDAMVDCLQEAAVYYAAKCNGAGCEPDTLSRVIGLAQRTHCGYDAAESKGPRPVPSPPLLRCLRKTADETTAACEKGGCLSNSVFFIIGAAQRSRCGYTAYEPMEMPATSPPNVTVASCVTSRNARGEWVTACAP